MRFYQKVRKLFSLSSDYDKTDKATQMFFAEVQNKLLYAVNQKTAAEIVLERSNPNEPNMGLTSWAGQVVRKGDVIVAKNYLAEREVDLLNRMVTIFGETAEVRVMEGRGLTLNYWKETVDQLLMFQNKQILQGAGSVTNAEMERIAKERYEQFNERRKQQLLQAAEAEDMKELQQLEADVKKRNNLK